MTFKQALDILLNEEPVGRACWPDGGQIHVANAAFHYTDEAGEHYPYELTTEDIFAVDWKATGPQDMTETPIDPWS